MYCDTLLLIFAFDLTLRAQVLSFAGQDIYAINLCYNEGSYSTKYACSEYGVTQFIYYDTSTCDDGEGDVNRMAGCSDEDSLYYYVDNCEEAQANTNNGTDDCGYVIVNDIPTPLDTCYTPPSSGTYSWKYVCFANNSTVVRYEYADPDCQGTSFIDATFTTDLQCGSKNCGVTLTTYTVSGDSECNHKDGLYRSATPRSSTCKYIALDNNQYGIDVCLSGRQGYHTYSQKYVCNEDTHNVELWNWLESDSCDGEYKYLQSVYNNASYKFECDGAVCNHKIRNYGSGCTDSSEYTETSYIWNQCLPYYNDPEATIYSYQELVYYMNTCVDGYRAIFYYTDPECNDANTYIVYNTSNDDCDSILLGCSNGNDQFTAGSNSLSINYYIIASLFSMLMYFW
jgi:hypothetical protein